MITAVTTFSKDLWDMYANETIGSWMGNWPGPIIAYHEVKPPDDIHPQIIQRDLTDQADAMAAIAWASKMKILRGYTPNGEYNYNFNFHKFSRKVFAITDALQKVDGGLVYWLDADILMKKPIPEQFLKDQLKDVYTCCMGRKDWSHTETGLLGFDADHEWNKKFPAMFRSMFTELTVLVLPGFHDCYAYDYLVFTEDTKIPVNDLTAHAEGCDVFEQSVFHEYMTHYKGAGKKYTNGREVA